MLNSLKKIFQVLSWLSIDVALGAVVLTNSIAFLFGIVLPLMVSFALFLCVWITYTLDHLLDAKRISHPPSMPRHQFHYRFSTQIFYLLILVATLSLWVVFFLPYQTVLYGVIVAGFVALYVLLTWWLHIFRAKELIISMLYTVGVFVGPFSCGLRLDGATMILTGEIWLLAMMNLMIYSMYDLAYDRKDGFSSWATIFGSKRLKKMIIAVFVLLIISIAFGFFYNQSFDWMLFQMIIFFMSLGLLAFFLGRDVFPEYKNRWLGDVIFFFPAIIFLF